MGCSVSSCLTMILFSSCQLPADPCLIAVGSLISFFVIIITLKQQCALWYLADLVKGRLYTCPQREDCSYFFPHVSFDCHLTLPPANSGS